MRLVHVKLHNIEYPTLICKYVPQNIVMSKNDWTNHNTEGAWLAQEVKTFDKQL